MAVATGVSSTVDRVQRKKFALVLLFLQVVFIILYSILVRYSDDPTVVEAEKSSGDLVNRLYRSQQPGFQDVHLLVFLGFGLLVAFLKRYACSGLGYNLLIGAVVLQWGVFLQQLFVSRFQPIVISMETLLNGDFCAVAVLVSFGAVFGKLSPLQLVVMAVIEVFVYSVNRYIGVLVFQGVDVGYSMYVHMFGAYFGLAVSRFVHVQHHSEHPQESRTYQSDIFTMIGTLFLWVCFPSFNAAMAPAVFQQRAFMNTIFASAACVLVTFIMTTLLSKDEKFGIVHLQNCVLSGAVAVGTAAHLLIKPYGAMLVGAFAAIISVLGFTHIGPCLARKLRIHDTRGVHNVHGLPGIFAGIISIIAAALASQENYGYDVYRAFPGMVPNNMTTDAAIISDVNNGVLRFNVGLTAGQQAGMQAATLVVSFVIAIIGGVITGFILRLRFWEVLSANSVFDDRDYWNVNEEGMPLYTVYVPPPPPTTDAETATHEETVELKPAKEAVQEEEPEKEEK